MSDFVRPFSIRIPLNRTMLTKRSIDTPLRLSEALAAYGIHDYGRQEPGKTESVGLTLEIEGSHTQAECHFSRPRTHSGRFRRLWITGLAPAAHPGDVLRLDISTDARMTASLDQRADNPKLGVEIDAAWTGADFSGYRGGRRLVQLLEEHVLIVMGGMVECQPGSYLGATASEIEAASDLGLDAFDHSHALVKAVLASLVRSDLVEAKKRRNAYFYNLVRADAS